jgi:hypothetical protein
VVLGDTHIVVPLPGAPAPSFINAAPGLPRAIMDLDPAPAFLLHTGDLVGKGYRTGAYEHFEASYRELLDRFPLFPCAGNHDLYSVVDAAGNKLVGGMAFKAYLQRQLLEANRRAAGEAFQEDFELAYGENDSSSADQEPPPDGPGFETYYAFRHANAYFISLEVGQHNWRHTPVAWLESQLRLARSDASIDHVFVFLHSPLYSSVMGDWSDMNTPVKGYVTGKVREAYEQALRDHDVTMVFSGHAHLYERFLVPRSGQPAATSSPAPLEPVTHYLVTGGGGGGNLFDCSNPVVNNQSKKFLQRRRCARHFLHVQVEGKNITVTVTEVWGWNAEAPHTRSIEQIHLRAVPDDRDSRPGHGYR